LDELRKLDRRSRKYLPGVDAYATSTADGNAGDVATFGSLASSGTAGINFNNTTSNNGVGNNSSANGSLTLSAIVALDTLNKNLTVGKSDTSTFAAALTLNGATVNGVDNVILRNNSANLLTVTGFAGGSGSAPMSLALVNSTNNVINVDAVGGVTIAAAISGASKQITKGGNGAGVFSLTGTNTYSGNTTVNAGKLRLAPTSGTNNIASSPKITVASGATFDVTDVGGVAANAFELANNQTLAGTGTVTGKLTVASGSKISPGDAGVAGTLTTGSHVWASGGKYELDLTNSGHDEIHMSSLSVTATSSSKFTVQLVQPGMLSANNWVTVATGTGLTGWDPDKFELPPEHAIRAFDGTNEITGTSFGGAFSIQVQAVPEPGALSFVGGAAALTLIRRRRAAR
jgi:autotransporter-associated beta strand protein